MRGAGEDRLGRGGVADLAVEDDVGAVAPRPRRTGLGCDEAVRHRRQRLVLDHEQFSGVLSRGDARRDDGRDDLADMAHLRPDDRGLLRPDDRRAVLDLDADIGRVAVGDVR